MEVFNVKGMIESMPIKPATKAFMSELLVLMVKCKSEEKGSKYRSDLQLIINVLAYEEIIDPQQHDALGFAFGELWKPIARAFAIDRINREQGQIH